MAPHRESLVMTHAMRDMTLAHGTARPPTVIGAFGYGTRFAKLANDAAATQPAYDLFTAKPFLTRPSVAVWSSDTASYIGTAAQVGPNSSTGHAKLTATVKSATKLRAGCCCAEVAETRPCRDAGDGRMQSLQYRNYLAPAACGAPPAARLLSGLRYAGRGITAHQVGRCGEQIRT